MKTYHFNVPGTCLPVCSIITNRLPHLSHAIFSTPYSKMGDALLCTVRYESGTYPLLMSGERFF